MKAQRQDYTLYSHKMCQITVLHMLIRYILFGAFKGLSLQTSEAILFKLLLRMCNFC